MSNDINGIKRRDVMEIYTGTLSEIKIPDMAW